MIQVKIGLNASPPPPAEEERSNGEDDDDQVELVEKTGVITALDTSLQAGVIERKYRFDTTKFSEDGNPFKKGTRVEFRAERSLRSPQWRVTSMTVCESPLEKVSKERNPYRKVTARVKVVNQEEIQVEMGKDLSKLKTLTIPNKNEFYQEFAWLPGKFIKLQIIQGVGVFHMNIFTDFLKINVRRLDGNAREKLGFDKSRR